jgi:hypothetical protein
MPVASPRPDDQWMQDQLEACRITWPDYHDFRIEKENDGPLFVYGGRQDDPSKGCTVLVSIVHPEAWSLLSGMLWGS